MHKQQKALQKLALERAKVIRQRIREGQTVRVIAAVYGVSTQRIYQILGRV